ncbi:MAG: PilW family protein [Pseudomonadota bacterium]
MTMRSHPTLRAQQGFTLIELMVGVVLGMLAIVAIAQVLVLSEGNKRSITSGADAQISGALGLFSLQREVGMSGYGVSAIPAALGCTVNYQAGTNPAGTFTLAPVLIGAGDDGSDTITILRSTKNSFSVPMLVTAAHASASTEFTVQSPFGAAVGDLMLAVPPDVSTSNCNIFQVSGNPLNQKIPHVTVATSPWNVAAASANAFPINSYLFNLGSMSMQRFSVNKDTRALERSELASTSGAWSAAEEVQPQVVMLKAMYGKDTNADGSVDTYNTTTPTNNAEWTQVRSIRVLIVARSGQPEKTAEPTPALLEWDVGTKNDTVTGATTCHTDRQCISIDLSPLGADFRKYRYKLYDTVIPLRNVLWKA